YRQTFTSGTSAGADKQFYYNPPNLREIESIVLTNSGGTDFVLTPVYEQTEWDRINAQIVSSDYPRKYFRRTNDYGIYPTPNEDDYTIVLNYTQRAFPLYFEDYSTGTVTATNDDETLTFVTGVTTTMKAGFWFTLTDSNGEPRGSWYRIASITDSANLELETFFSEATEATQTYLVGQIPEIPEETIILPAVGAVSDFYALKQKDMTTATRFDNKFWSGNYNVTALQAKKDGDYGGLLAAIDAYADRDQSIVVNRVPVARDIMDFQMPRTADLG
ncbi:hypothetical protein LCGC14_2569930, partial [marine sediment metagenome]